ncbi:MAG: toxin-activating lysine-acyltransferase [Rhodospirillales bacterium]|nr:toxin-activating lysine-acyltransferase [Rhodospirillales bacterium]
MTDKSEIDQRPVGVGGSKPLPPDEFGLILGLASWLMTMSKEHRDRPISVLDKRVLPGILLKQFKLIRKDKMPVAFISWATVSDEVKARLESDETYAPEITEWRSGRNLVIVECVSPFGPAAEVKQHFINGMIKTA